MNAKRINKPAEWEIAEYAAQHDCSIEEATENLIDEYEYAAILDEEDRREDFHGHWNEQS